MIVYPSVGQCFGRYKISGLLGQGGMGVVFSAVHEGLDRHVALKILSPTLALQPSFRQRFSREAVALASLYSPHIIDIYDHGEIDGCLYIATQYVSGGDLGDWLERDGGLPPAVALALVSQVTSAVADAHDAGVIHRDIKPSNVLLRRSDASGIFAYLGDFGIARTLEEERTRSSGVIGTLAYMAPERHEGADASMRTDIYSLGCLLWATLTGRPPYRGPDVQVAIQHLEAPLPTYPGTDAFARSVNVLLQQSMAKNPTDRYPTAGAMLTDLARAAALVDDPAARWTTTAIPSPRVPHDGTRSHPTAKGAGAVAASQRRPRPLSALVAAAVLVMSMVGAVLGFETWSADPVTCADGTVVDDKDSCDVAAATSSAPVSDEMTCWNGALVRRRAACPPPEGLDGLTWMFPSLQRDFERCHRRFDATPDASLQAWFCRTPGASPSEGISYTEWADPAAARAYYDHQFDRRPVNFLVKGRAAGFRWMGDVARPSGLYKVSMAYVNQPFSTSVYSRSLDGLERACTALMVRSMLSFEASPTECTGRTEE